MVFVVLGVAVLLTVTSEEVGDAFARSTFVLVISAPDWSTGTASLIRMVLAIVVLIAKKIARNAKAILAFELAQRTSLAIDAPPRDDSSRCGRSLAEELVSEHESHLFGAEVRIPAQGEVTA